MLKNIPREPFSVLRHSAGYDHELLFFFMKYLDEVWKQRSLKIWHARTGGSGSYILFLRLVFPNITVKYEAARNSAYVWYNKELSGC